MLVRAVNSKKKLETSPITRLLKVFYCNGILGNHLCYKNLFNGMLYAHPKCII